MDKPEPPTSPGDEVVPRRQGSLPGIAFFFLLCVGMSAAFRRTLAESRSDLVGAYTVICLAAGVLAYIGFWAYETVKRRDPNRDPESEARWTKSKVGLAAFVLVLFLLPSPAKDFVLAVLGGAGAGGFAWIFVDEVSQRVRSTRTEPH